MRVLIVTENLPRRDGEHVTIAHPGDPLFGLRVDVIICLEPHVDDQWWELTALARLVGGGHVLTL